MASPEAQLTLKSLARVVRLTPSVETTSSGPLAGKVEGTGSTAHAATTGSRARIVLMLFFILLSSLPFIIVTGIRRIEDELFGSCALTKDVLLQEFNLDEIGFDIHKKAIGFCSVLSL
jgi:hypothetical protein